MSLRLLRHSWTTGPLSRSTIMFLGLVRSTMSFVVWKTKTSPIFRGQQHCGGHAGRSLGHFGGNSREAAGFFWGGWALPSAGVCLKLDAVPVALGDQHQCGWGPLSWRAKLRTVRCRLRGPLATRRLRLKRGAGQRLWGLHLASPQDDLSRWHSRRLGTGVWLVGTPKRTPDRGMLTEIQYLSSRFEGSEQAPP